MFTGMNSEVSQATAAAQAGSFPLPQGHEQVVATLYEGDYHLGVAGLINSVVRMGFKGLFWIGIRGDLPAWTAPLKRRSDGLFEVGEALLGFEDLKTERHFGQYKSVFLSQVAERGITARYLWYFDPDIALKCDWSFIERWVRHGISLCEDSNYGTMPSTHPLRCEWIELARAAGWGEPVSRPERYLNSGFVGMDIAHRAFLAKWMAAVELAHLSGVTHGQFQKGNRERTFFTVDQDTMNIAAMYTDAPFSLIGPEGMGFTPSPLAMLHAVSKPKPWRKAWLRSALRGVPPTNADKQWLASLDGPVWPYPAGKLSGMRRRASLAALIGRFYMRR
jgi:hypothetical protein